MFFIFGTHLFGLKRYAYKYMGCSNCERARLFIQTRGFAWGHLFWIPLIPLGYQSSWNCAACAKEDNSRPTSFVLKFVVLIALLFSFYMITIDDTPKDLGEYAILWQVGLGILTFWSLYETFNHFKKKKKNQSKYMYPLPDSEYCAICDGDLEIKKNGKLQCKDCKCFALDIEELPNKSEEK